MIFLAYTSNALAVTTFNPTFLTCYGSFDKKDSRGVSVAEEQFGFEYNLNTHQKNGQISINDTATIADEMNFKISANAPLNSDSSGSIQVNISRPTADGEVSMMGSRKLGTTLQINTMWSPSQKMSLSTFKSGYEEPVSITLFCLTSEDTTFYNSRFKIGKKIVRR